ncbi:MAG: hypothetical protein BGO78_14000 [Chloroflexi bacterium 44-23]|nr:MAG: hypothetical protein BGO78_14000 [Chloroflexi bacterium 44-23]
MKILKLIFSGIVLFIVIIFSGCISIDKENIEATNVLPTFQTTVQMNTTRTPSPSITITVSPIVTKTNTGIRPTRTPTSTPIPFTVFPTLENEKYQLKFQDWYNNQEDCAFPCLWNIEPGKTDILSVWNTVHDIFPDHDCIYIGDSFFCIISNRQISRELRKPKTGMSAYFENNQIEKITIFGDFPNKSLSKIINDLGFPDEAYLHHLIGGEGFAESSLILIFTKFHTVIEYYKVIQMTTNPSLNFCIDNSNQPSIDLFPQGKQIRFLELSNYSEIPYRLFSDVTGVSFSDYYRNHVSNDGTLCIISNREEW